MLTDAVRKFHVCLGILLLAGCASQPHYTASSRPEQRIGRVYLFRGVISSWTAGVDEFAADLWKEGFRAGVYENLQEIPVIDEIVRGYAKESSHEPLILIGYSTGSECAITVAKRLAVHQVPVDLLITLDPLVTTHVPPNVRVCYNYYETIIPGLPLLSGEPLRADPPVQLKNVKVTSANVGKGVVQHFTLHVQKQLWAEVMTKMKALCPLRGDARSATAATEPEQTSTSNAQD